MRTTGRGSVQRRFARRRIRVSKARLDALVAEAIVDAYNEAEQAAGFLTMIEDNLRLPLETEILGMKVMVERLDRTEDDAIVAVCRRGSKRQRVPILDLPLPSPQSEGTEWVAAYRYWRTGRQ